MLGSTGLAGMCGDEHVGRRFRAEASASFAVHKLAAVSSQSDSSTVDATQVVPPTTDAPAPFNKPTADLILRSSDGMNFRVRKAILAEASPVFEDMFMLPTPQDPAESPNNLPVVPMTEDSRTLEGLLRLCYPFNDMPSQTLDQTSAMLNAAKKYAMDGAQYFLYQKLLSFAETSPVQVYVLSVRHELPEVAKAAAQAFLALTIPNNELRKLANLRHISASALMCLIEYRERCVVAATGVFDNYAWIDGNRWCWLETFICCQCHVRYDTFGNGVSKLPRVWWVQFMGRCRGLVKTNPCIAEALKDAGSCGRCASRAPVELDQFVVCLMAEVDNAVAQVELDMEW
ncbi:uncharacterized protein B0H18DRAFT_990184 [Fomitopsis serialis]|uniref:uncharacterized protein n=1 Tax=Fomitopsis serialis TaxID=139415 RepID=UPI0020082011|nr:uncharacterized protein B0H18DRAFT_990184 [Neoantrodia serialis]KAH9931598.1 hypothetical protein B0H18DRAFT_990184 [Neoantrodia serialis]